ncbi:hypothetical protein [Sandaracinobacteroides saxicola]|uniref:Uncharacterized protein n=1 Tax=Sandaracinobacteroides saxicola TaxID=2759707 RepID=A0A7G5IM22_9SPHN|nr:hypothetical protein [Sandaracinobacteroides saxicola]QMW24414.1 hypothetical protein H3309_08195 [Sandaracinobacteroides saxicola]
MIRRLLRIAVIALAVSTCASLWRVLSAPMAAWTPVDLAIVALTALIQSALFLLALRQLRMVVRYIAAIG